MTAYIIVAARVDKRTEGFIEYSKRAGELTTRCGGEYIVRGPAETVLEGDMWSSRPCVVSRWPSLEAAKAFWNSQEYQEVLKPLRADTGLYDVGLFEGT
ncbi:DUF1330 domain-containing protein [Candidatus Foliamicus sp.]